MKVTSITPDRLNPHRRVVKVDGKRVVTLHADGVEALALHQGCDWTPVLRQKAAARLVYEKARTSATRWTSKQALPRSRVAQRLERYQLTASDRAFLLDELQSRGLVNDAEFAEAVVETKLNREPVGLEALLAGLKRRGVGDEEARDAAIGALRTRDVNTDALASATKRLSSLPQELSEDTIRRRLFAYLARRGYDEETATRAIERAMRAR